MFNNNIRKKKDYSQVNLDDFSDDESYTNDNNIKKNNRYTNRNNNYDNDGYIVDDREVANDHNDDDDYMRNQQVRTLCRSNLCLPKMKRKGTKLYYILNDSR